MSLFRVVLRAALTLAAVSAPLQLQAAIIPGTEITGNGTGDLGDFRYVGIGQQGATGRGTGFYSLGTCGAVSAGETTCSLAGAYSLTGANTGTGNFQMRMIYPGSGSSPITAISQTPGSNELFLLNLNGGRFELDLFPSEGGQVSGLFPDSPFADSIGWSGFAQELSCIGLPSGVPCSIGNVGLNSGAVASGSVGRLFFRFPASANTAQPPTEVPEPGLLALVGLGVAALLMRRRVRFAAVTRGPIR